MLQYYFVRNPLMTQKAHLHIVRKKVKSLNIETIQKIIFWLYENKKKPSFLGCFNKENFKSLNILFSEFSAQPNIANSFKNKISGTLQEHISLDELHSYIFKKIDRETIIPNLKYITENDIQPFLLLKPESIYQEDYLFVASNVSLAEDKKESNTEQSLENKNPYNYYSTRDLLKFDKFNHITEHFLVSIDCEMVITTKGKELGRLSILDNNGNTIYDKYIQPEHLVTDFCTKYSGLDVNSFKDAISFKEMKKEIKNIIGKNTTILGHSLYNDLTILKIYHHKIIDTSRLFRTKDNYKISLKNLAKKYLKQEIQNDVHCSVEDARMCLLLLAIKIKEYWMYKNTEKKLIGSVMCNLRIKYNELKTKINERAINTCFIGKNESIDLNLDEIQEDSIFLFFYNEKNKIGYHLWTKSLIDE
ncbi:Exonuclease [Spraguea lophii 42_110]|uniref:Exonuclease n=1 Tax=Spraguea lophii (strain 42_110) TaxID=1358809 RepID=S7W7D5_SPRLO|nr:Exonuclease [Spraguea lophii 42_110]